MELHTLVQRLATGEAAAERNQSFSVGGPVPDVLPNLQVPGVGLVGLIGWPLKMATAKNLIAVCQQAPFGKGEQTLVDARVRDTFELAPDQFSITNPEWNQAIQGGWAPSPSSWDFPPSGSCRSCISC